MAIAERVDAQRNRERLLDATRRLFAEHGVDVPVREIAGEAGVGIATLYRHFPTRDGLVDAVLEDAFDALIADGEWALEQGDAWVGFTGLVERTLERCARDRGLRDAFETERGRTRAAAMRRRLRPILAELVERAQKQGTLRPDFTAQDVWLVFWGANGVIAFASDVAADLWRRQLGFVLDGLQATGATRLSQPSLTEAQLRRVGR